MKAAFVSGVALIALCTGAAAADLVERHVITADIPALPPPPPLPPIAVIGWAGAYGGLNVGGGFGVGDAGVGRRLRGTAVDGSTASIDPARRGTFLRNADDGGVLGGGQIGYNLQFGNVVVGVEADAQATGLDTRDGFRDLDDGFGNARPRGTVVTPRLAGEPGNVAFFHESGSNDVGVFGTVRGRLGFAFDEFLVYGTGGLAWTVNDDHRGAFADGASVVARRPGFFVRGGNGPAATRAARIVPGNDGRDHIGYTIGAGVEYAFSHSLSAKLEGLYVDFGEERGNRTVGVTNTGGKIRLVGNQDHDFGVIRTGFNYRFGTY